MFSKLKFVYVFWILNANREGEILFAYRTSFSGMMNLKAGFCSKISLLFWSGRCFVTTCMLDIGLDLKHPLDILMASFDTDSRLPSSLSL